MVDCDKKQFESILVLLVGLPASGKSSLAQNIKSLISNTKIVSLDECQLEVIKDEDLDSLAAWHRSKEYALAEVKDMLIDQVCKILIVDDTFEYSSMRKPYFQTARDVKPTSYIEVHLKCEVETAIANNKTRKNPMGVTEENIRNIH